MSQRFEPPSSQAGEPYWAATKKHEFVIQHCNSCNKAIHHPRDICPHCYSLDLEFRPVSGRGEVHAFSVMHRPGNPLMADRVPYVVALIDLAEGARMMSNVVGCDPADVTVGMPVQVTWEDLSDGRALPVFEPTTKGETT